MIIAIKHLETGTKQKREDANFLICLMQVFFCTNQYFRALMNKSVEEVNGADIYYLVYAMHLGRL